MTLSTLLPSMLAVIAAIIAGVVAFRTSERKIAIENVTQERTKWRDKIRDKNSSMATAFYEHDLTKMKIIRMELRLLLNPLDLADEEILNDAKVLAQDGTEDDLYRFSTKLALLLKHDWERAKHEASPPLGEPSSPPERIRDDRYLETQRQGSSRRIR